MTQQCVICKKPIPDYSWNHPEPGARIKCSLCGEYRISEYLATQIYPYELTNKHILSASIREHYEQGVILWVDDLNKLKDSVAVPNGPLESIDRILLYIYNKTNSANECAVLNPGNDYSVAYAKSPTEFEYLLEKAQELQYIEEPFAKSHYRLKLDGWKHLNEIRQHKVDFDQAFVAMWFHKDMDEGWENGFRPALEQTGYKPIRIDLTEHNEKICDRIIAEIRKSGLLIADFTGQRGGVYFEAGFAMGLGIPVIWTCQESDISNLHFDTRQYNHIAWKTAADLKEKLINRIEATLPQRK